MGKSRKWMTAILCIVLTVQTGLLQIWGGAYEETGRTDPPAQLYARSAVLLDGDSGRVLYEKNGFEELPMASTTKVMTCILALENSDGDEVVQVSEYAASQPEVKLNIQRGEQYYLEDLLYSLMLKSHNDTAVAIAEHIGGSVEGFARLMNQKAAELGCDHTYFITPNGLDAKDDKGIHSTTARDLAILMRYAIKNETFLRITQTMDYSFRDVGGSRRFMVHNTNAFLGMMEGAISGKTGFTADAGYCYVGALKRGERTFIVALLACGWPNHKSYKWSDTKKLMEYGLHNYEYQEVWQDKSYGAVQVKDGIPKSSRLNEQAYVNVRLAANSKKGLRLLLHREEQVKVEEEIPTKLLAPVQEGEIIGSVTYSLNGYVLRKNDLVAGDTIFRRNYRWCYRHVIKKCFSLCKSE